MYTFGSLLKCITENICVEWFIVSGKYDIYLSLEFYTPLTCTEAFDASAKVIKITPKAQWL